MRHLVPTHPSRLLVATTAAVAVALTPLLVTGPAVASAAPASGAANSSPTPAGPGHPAPPSADDSRVALDLSGTWRFALGDDPTYADPGFDDSGWTTLQVPEVDGAPQFDDYDGFGWYRLTFDLPASAAGANLVASLGFVDDVDEAFLNGVRIGGSGSMPPQGESQWFEQRLYPVPADVPVFGGSNTLAVRVYDMSGGGGWYRGPVGLYSKDALREEVHGITGRPADARTTARVTRVLRTQARALATGDVDAYVATLAPEYFHDGRDLERRERELRAWVAESGTLTLTDEGVEVIVTTDGRLIADTNRTLTGTRDGAPFAFTETTQQFLAFDRRGHHEVGNRSRFFRDHVESEVEGARREYVVYLPPSYLTDPNREFPVVYLLHGINGGSREWEPRDMDDRLDALYTGGGLEESVVVMPDGESLWYVDHEGGTPWRSMFLDELVPQVDAEYRTLDARDFRGLSGVSMGGFGAFSIGLANPDRFSSLASHFGALNVTPAFFGIVSPGGPAAQVGSPITDAGAMSAEELSRLDFYLDACEFDDYRFDDALRTFSSALDAKGVEHTAVVVPEGRHNDDCWLPRAGDSFGMHSDRVREALRDDGTAPTVRATLDPVTRRVTLEGDDDTGIRHLQYALNRNDGTFTEYTGPVQVGNGAVNVRLRAVDVAGNLSPVTTFKVMPPKAGGRR